MQELGLFAIYLGCLMAEFETAALAALGLLTGSITTYILLPFWKAMTSLFGK